MYVVGFIGDDDALGRTFICYDYTEAEEAYTILVNENKEKESFFDFEYLKNDSCVQYSPIGMYFMGQLESL